MIDLEWRQQQPDSLKFSADILPYNHVKEKLHVVENEAP
jgi:hypothetical protein